MYHPLPFEEVFLTAYWTSVALSALSELVRNEDEGTIGMSLGLVLTPIVNTYLALHFIGIIIYHLFRRRK